MGTVRCPVVELRQYTLYPGQRDVLIDIFDREFVETQEAAGMAILGQFRDLDRPGHFVWLRGFSGTDDRARALDAFYTGPAWKAHGARAAATMIDSDDVLLLRPVRPDSGFPAPVTRRPPPGPAAVMPPSRILATICYRDRPFDEEFACYFDREVRPALAGAGGSPLACFQTEYAENGYPALPVRTGENVFAWFTRFASHADLDEYLGRPARPGRWRDEVLPVLRDRLCGAPELLRLAPTSRSLLR